MRVPNAAPPPPPPTTHTPFFSAAKYMTSPLFQQKVYDWPHFSGLVYERPPFSDVSRYMHIFFSFIEFLRLLFSWYSMNWLLYCLTISNKPQVQKSKGSIWMDQHFRPSRIWMGPFLQRPGRFQNTGSNTRTIITPSYLPTRGLDFVFCSMTWF